MNFNTGLGLVVLGGSLLLATLPKTGARKLASAGVGFVLILALLTLFEYLLSTNLGIDELLFSGPSRIGTTHPGRMAWQTALVFVLLALAVLLVRCESRWSRRPTQWLAVAALIFPTQALMGYVLGRMTILGLGPEGPYMAVPTAIAFACAAVALLLHEPNQYWMGLLTARTPGSAVCRRLLIASIFLPVVLGAIALHVAGGAAKPPEYSVATIAWLTTLAFLALVGETLVSLTSDITQRRRTEEGLHRERERVALALKTGQMGVYDLNLADQTLWWSPEIYLVFGVSNDSFTPTIESFSALVHPEDREILWRRLHESIARGEPFLHEFRIIRPDGTIRWIGNRAQTDYDSKGMPVRHFGVAIDVTDRRLADEELRHQRERLTLALEGAELAAWDWNIVTGAVTLDERWWRMRGYVPEESFPHIDTFMRGIHPDDLAQMQAALDEHLKGSAPYYVAEFRVKTKAGGWIWIADRGKVFERDANGRPSRMLGTELDITSRKHLEQRLAVMHAITRVLAESPAVAVAIPKVLQIIGESLGWDVGDFWTLDSEANVLRCLNVWHVPSARVEPFKKVSYARTFKHGASLPGRTWKTLRPIWIPDVTQDSIFVRTNEALAAGLRAAFAFPILSGEKCLGVMEFFSPESRELDDALLQVFSGIGTQIGQFIERKEAEEALQKSEERFDRAQRAAHVGIWDWDVVTGAASWTDEAWRIFGRTQGEFTITYDNWLACVHPDDRASAAADVEAARQRREYRSEYRVLDPSGNVRWVESRGESVYNEMCQPVRMIGSVLDITDRKRAQEELRGANEKLASHAVQLETLVRQRTARLTEMVNELQHLSYAITHDMRAPLRAMSAFSEMLLEKASNASPETQDYCRRILTAAHRLDKLIQDALSYTTTVLQELPLEPVNLSTLLRGIIDTYPNLHFDKADIQIEGSLPTVLGNESLLTQCFSNLFGNAVKFVAPGTRPIVRIWADVTDGFARISVHDNGVGIPQHAQQRVFGMFQKLDKEHEGTGIGLAIVRKVVERMGGKVGVDSEVGKGSRFWVELPLAPNN